MATTLKPPTKEMLEEFEKKVEELRNRGLEKNATKAAEQLEAEMAEVNGDEAENGANEISKG